MKDTGIKFETLHKGFNFKKVFIGLVVIVAIGSVVILKGSKANYTYQEIIPFAEGVVRIRKADLNLMAVNIQKANGCTDKDTCYESTKDVPESGYKINEENSYCTVDDGTTDIEDETIQMEYENGKINFEGITKKGIRCYIYLDIKETAKDKILATSKKGTGNPDFNKTSCESGCGEETNGIYEDTDDYGTTYYFRGTVDDNWVKFGKVGNQDIYWRIIRINGDGSIRMIYSGTGNAATTGTDTQITVDNKNNSVFNSDYKDNANVGYMYGATGASSWANAHSNSSPSTIKGVIDSWYIKTNLSTLSTYLSDSAGFCGDREVKADSDYPGNGSGTQKTSYGARYRNETNKTPSFKCTYASNDLYTPSDNKGIGNGKLTYPIGLITADEVAFAGGVYLKDNTSYYLYTGSSYWTMSPSYFFSGYAHVFIVEIDYLIRGGFFENNVNETSGVRPVINLKADVSFTGSGTTTSPYTVS